MSNPFVSILSELDHECSCPHPTHLRRHVVAHLRKQHEIITCGVIYTSQESAQHPPLPKGYCSMSHPEVTEKL